MEAYSWTRGDTVNAVKLRELKLIRTLRNMGTRRFDGTEETKTGLHRFQNNRFLNGSSLPRGGGDRKSYIEVHKAFTRAMNTKGTIEMIIAIC